MPEEKVSNLYLFTTSSNCKKFYQTWFNTPTYGNIYSKLHLRYAVTASFLCRKGFSGKGQGRVDLGTRGFCSRKP